MEDGLKSLLTVGGVAAVLITNKVAMAEPIVLTKAPPFAEVTFTVTVQLPEAAMVPPLRSMVAVPAIAVRIPPQVLVVVSGVATTNPLGKLSVNAAGTGLALGFITVMVRVETPFTLMTPGVKTLLSGGVLVAVGV